MLAHKIRQWDKQISRTKIKATTAPQNGRKNINGHSHQEIYYLKALATSPTNQKKPATVKVSGPGSRIRTRTETKKKQKIKSIK